METPTHDNQGLENLNIEFKIHGHGTDESPFQCLYASFRDADDQEFVFDDGDLATNAELRDRWSTFITEHIREKINEGGAKYYYYKSYRSSEEPIMALKINGKIVKVTTEA